MHWTLSAKELALLAGRTGHGRFGFAVLLKYFQYEGRFPDSRREAPAEVVRYLAEQLRTPLKALDHYDWQGRTAKRQRTEILSWHGIRRHLNKPRTEGASIMQANFLPHSCKLATLPRSHNLRCAREASVNRKLRGALRNAYESSMSSSRMISPQGAQRRERRPDGLALSNTLKHAKIIESNP